MVSLKEFLGLLKNKESNNLNSLFFDIRNKGLYEAFAAFIDNLPDDINTDKNKINFIVQFFESNKLREQDIGLISKFKNNFTSSQIKNMGSGNIKNELFKKIFDDDSQAPVFIIKKYLKAAKSKHQRKNSIPIYIELENELNLNKNKFKDFSFDELVKKYKTFADYEQVICRVLPPNYFSLSKKLKMNNDSLIKYISKNQGDYSIRTNLASALNNNSEFLVEYLAYLNSYRNEEDFFEGYNEDVVKCLSVLKKEGINILAWGCESSHVERFEVLKKLVELDVVETVNKKPKNKSDMNDFLLNEYRICLIAQQYVSDEYKSSVLAEIQESLFKEALKDKNNSKKISI